MTEKRFWLVPMDYYGEPRFVKDKKLIGEKSMSNQEVVDLLNEQDMFIKSQDKLIHSLHEAISRQSDRIEELASEDAVELLEKMDKDLLEARTYAMELILKKNRLQRLIDDLGGEEMKRQMEVILNE